MIDFDFTFVQPKTVDEAIKAYEMHSETGNSVMYFGGGTEFISRGRAGEIAPNVVIDLKHIPECQVFEVKDGQLLIGAAVTLSDITDSNLFPLLSDVTRGIATRTERNKISIGGNLLSDLPYKEAMLPFLLADSEVVIATKKGLIKRSIEKLTPLKGGDFLVQIITEDAMTKAPFTYVKRTRQSSVNYPIVTLASLQMDRNLRLAVSGFCETPVRSRKMEELLQDQEATSNDLVEKTLKTIQDDVIDDELATRAYRTFVLERLLHQVVSERKNA